MLTTSARLTRRLARLAALVLLAAGAPPAAPSEPRQIVMAIEAEPESLDPIRFRGGPALGVLWQIYDGLFELGHDLVPRPVLAESVQVSRDGLTYTVHLKRGVNWHDGRPFTAQDVAFTIRAHLDPANGSLLRERFHALAGFPELTDPLRPARYETLRKKPVEVVDRHTLRLNLRYPYAAVLTALVSPEAAIVSRHRRDPIGTGPFRLVEWRPGDRLVLEANASYHRGRPGLDRVVVAIVPEMADRLTRLESGEIQLLGAPAPDAVARLQRNPRLATLSGDDVNFRAVLFQTAHPALADRRVRQAIAGAIDARAIRATVVRGHATAANGPIPPNSWAFTAAVRPTPHDPERARRLLAEAGYVPGTDGVLEREGRRLALGLVVESHETLADVARAIATQLAAVGIAVSIEPLEPEAWSARFASGRYDLLLLASAGSVDPDPITYGLLRSGQPRNTSGYADARVDDILDRARSARTQTERRRLYGELLEVLEQEKPIHVLYHQQRWYAFDRRYRGFEYVGVPGGLLQSLRRVTVRP